MPNCRSLAGLVGGGCVFRYEMGNSHLNEDSFALVHAPNGTCADRIFVPFNGAVEDKRMVDVTTAKAGVNVKLRSFSRSLPMALLLAREAMMNRFRPALKLFNITEQQWRVLRALSSVKEIEVMELAKATSLLAPSLSRILRDMEERGLVERRQVPDDLRRSLTSISADGLKLIDAVAPYSESIYQEITTAVGREKMDQLQQMCREIVGMLGELEPRNYSNEELDPEIARIVGDSNRGRPREER